MFEILFNQIGKIRLTVSFKDSPKGISDKLLGQIVQVYVVTKQEMSIKDQDIVTFCKGKLENYKIPRIFTYLSKLPKNELGKLLRSRL